MSSTVRRRMWSGAVALATLLIALTATTAPAHAFSPNPQIAWVTQNAGNCAEIVHDAPAGYFEVKPYVDPGNCAIYAWLWSPFPEDQGGQNAWFDVTAGAPVRGTKPLATIYFQAYGEHLKLKDLNADDQDSVYIWINGTAYCACLNTDIDLNLAEGSVWSIKITDDAAGTDVIACTNSCTNLLPHLYA